MSTDHIRVPLVVPGTDPLLKDIEAGILRERGRISLLYQVLLNSAPIAQGWEAMLSAVRNRTSVPADLREMMILRVAVLNRAEFEFEAHIPHARKAGISETRIEALRQDNPGEAFSPDELLVLTLTDQMTRNVEVSPELMLALGKRYDPRELVEIVTTIAAYNMVSRVLVALNIKH